MIRERTKSWRAPHYIPVAGKVRMSCTLRQVWAMLAKTQRALLCEKSQHTWDWDFLLCWKEYEESISQGSQPFRGEWPVQQSEDVGLTLYVSTLWGCACEGIDQCISSPRIMQPPALRWGVHVMGKLDPCLALPLLQLISSVQQAGHCWLPSSNALINLLFVTCCHGEEFVPYTKGAEER